MLFRRSTKHHKLSPWPSLRALAGAAATWQKRQRREEELLRCPGGCSGALVKSLFGPLIAPRSQVNMQNYEAV
eukprot:1157662-Pelagomonas_calceolata.AAC.1